MRSNIFKKVTATVLSLTLVVGMTNVVSAAHASNGANVANGEWKSFSVCTKEDGGKWYDAVQEVVKDNPEAQTYTEGWIVPGKTSSKFDFYVKNTGWDGEYNPYTEELVANNPWGLTADMTNIPVEAGRNYTISFKIKSTLKAENDVVDENGNPVTDESGEPVVNKITTKHIRVVPTDTRGEVTIISASGMTTGGYIEVDSATDEWKTVTANIQMPARTGTKLNIKFAMGAFLKDYPDELAMKGYVYVDDFKVTAGTQYAVKFTDPVSKKSTTKYVNPGAKVSSYAFTRKGYTLAGFKNGSSTYNFNSGVKSNLTLTAVWSKTKAPAKSKITKVTPAKKKATLTLKKVTGAKGYEISYSNKSNMKSAKKKYTSKTKITIKKLKSRNYTYFTVKTYSLDSQGNKVLSKASAKKKAYIR